MAAAADERCLDDDTAAAFVDLALTPDRRQRVEAHLDRCAACRVHVAALVRSESSSGKRDGDEPTHELLRAGTMLGRYRLERRLGAGGMGVVWLAHDSQLDRRVALKLPRGASPRSARAARAILREAQALARLSDPRIVEIYDVAEHAGRTYIAMRYIDGLPLDRWATTRRQERWREILRACIDAGRGLAAAHRAGVLHRDVKPSNIMVGATGEAFITDFGLSRLLTEHSQEDRVPVSREDAGVSSHTLTGALVGTALYMAPEQHRGTAIEASDQYAFCVSVFEALYGEHPFRGDDMPALLAAKLCPVDRPASGHHVPAWLHAVLERGLAAEPRRRWPTMDALLAALSRRRARVRPVHALAACCVLGIAVAAFGGLQDHERARTCEAAAADVDELWNDATRTQVYDALVATGASYAATTADKVTPWLDAHASAWAQARTEVCVRQVDWDDATIDRALWCLDERRLEFEALEHELSAATATTALHAVTAAARLSSVAECSDADLLARLLPPPPVEQRGDVRALRLRLFEAQALERAEAWDEALAVTRSVGEAAADLRWLQLVFAARANEARLLNERRAHADAERAAIEAYYGAASLGDWGTAADAGTLVVLLVGYWQARFDEGNAWTRHAEAALAQAPDPEGLRASELAGVVALLAQQSGEYPRARENYERCLAICERVLVGDHPDIAVSLANLATLLLELGEYDRATELLERALAIQERAFGPSHPELAVTLSNLGTRHLFAGRYARARGLFERSLAIREAAFGADDVGVADVIVNLGVLELETGDHASALRSFARALAILERLLGPDHPQIAVLLNNMAGVHYATGDYEQARSLRERALAIQEQALGPDHPGVAQVLELLANVCRAQGEHERARALLERALAINLAAFGPDHLKVGSDLHGLALEDYTGGDYSRARERYERAIAIWEKARGPDDRIVASMLTNYAHLQLALGDHAQALALHERVLATREALGRDRPDVAITLTNLAEVHASRGDPARALPLAERAVAIFDGIEGVQVGEPAARFRLAETLVATGGDRVRALELATQARDGWRTAGKGSADELARAEAWLLRVITKRRGR